MTEVFWFDMRDPGDYSSLQAQLGPVDVIERLAVMVKTEGHTAPNDFARQLSRASLDPMIAPLTERGRAVAVLANGCEGVATPGGYAFVRRSGGADGAGGLRLGVARSEPVPPAMIGTPGLVDAVADCVQRAVDDAGLDRRNATLAIVKCPTLLPSSTLREPFRGDQHRGRALAALGVAVAFGEVGRDSIDDDTIAGDPAIHSLHAMTFAGPEQSCIEAIVLGQHAGAVAVEDGLKVALCHPRDMLDTASVRRMLLSLGLTFDALGELVDPERVVAVLSKAGPLPSGVVRGARTGIFTSAYSPDSNMRAAQSGVLGGLFGTTRFFVSGDPVQQSTPGGGVVAVVVRTSMQGATV